MKVKKAYIGFDCSSKAIHGVILDDAGQLVHQQKWASSKSSYHERFIEITTNFWADNSRIKTILTEDKQAFAAIEAAIYIQNPHTTLAIASVVGCVDFICNLSGLDTQLIDNRKWKKDLLKKGNAKKSDILVFAKNKWGDVFEEQDFADAACIALWRKNKEEQDEKS